MPSANRPESLREPDGAFIIAHRRRQRECRIAPSKLLNTRSGRQLAKNGREAYSSPAMAEARILNSWKEISNYVGRGVRTVQRWEQLYGLPVHRAAGKDRSSVYALSDEVDAWLRAGKMHEQPKHEPSTQDPGRYSQLIERSRGLISGLQELRQQSLVLRSKIEQNKNLHKPNRTSFDKSSYPSSTKKSA